MKTHRGHLALCVNPEHQEEKGHGEHRRLHCLDKWARQKADPSLRLIGSSSPCASRECASLTPADLLTAPTRGAVLRGGSAGEGER